MADTRLSGGFADPARDSAVAFRAIMTAMARPGTIQDVSGGAAPAPVSPAAAIALLVLCDADTGLWLAPSVADVLPDWVAFHTGAPVVAPGDAQFALGRWDELDLTAFPIGTPEYPDRSTTLIIELDTLEPAGATLRGPGIKDTAQLSLPDLAPFQTNQALFPLGLDFIFTCGNRIAALPRSTEVL